MKRRQVQDTVRQVMRIRTEQANLEWRVQEWRCPDRASEDEMRFTYVFLLCRLFVFLFLAVVHILS